MILHSNISDLALHGDIRKHRICFGGHKKLKIYGTLNCAPGKRMKKENRVFFISQQQALDHGFRPCGHCMKHEYKAWKKVQ